MSFIEDLLGGVSVRLAQSGHYRYIDASTPQAVFNPDDSAVAWETDPPVDRTVTLRTYPVADDTGGTDSIVGIQFKVSASDLDFVDHAVDDIFDLFHDLWGATLGGVKVTQAQRRSGASLGQDERGRVSRTENYYFTVYRPATNRF